MRHWLTEFGTVTHIKENHVSNSQPRPLSTATGL